MKAEELLARRRLQSLGLESRGSMMARVRLVREHTSFQLSNSKSLRPLANRGKL